MQLPEEIRNTIQLQVQHIIRSYQLHEFIGVRLQDLAEVWYMKGYNYGVVESKAGNIFPGVGIL